MLLFISNGSEQSADMPDLLHVSRLTSHVCVLCCVCIVCASARKWQTADVMSTIFRKDPFAILRKTVTVNPDGRYSA